MALIRVPSGKTKGEIRTTTFLSVKKMVQWIVHQVLYDSGVDLRRAIANLCSRVGQNVHGIVSAPQFYVACTCPRQCDRIAILN